MRIGAGSAIERQGIVYFVGCGLWDGWDEWHMRERHAAHEPRRVERAKRVLHHPSVCGVHLIHGQVNCPSGRRIPIQHSQPACISSPTRSTIFQVRRLIPFPPITSPRSHGSLAIVQCG